MPFTESTLKSELNSVFKKQAENARLPEAQQPAPPAFPPDFASATIPETERNAIRRSAADIAQAILDAYVQSGGGGTDAWHSGASAPVSTLGADGDFYLRTSTGDIYRKASGSWGVPILNTTGAAGTNGWSPTPAIVADGERRVYRITWTGGTGTAPDDGYIGTTGIVDTAAAAVDIRGPAGPAGPAGTLASFEQYITRLKGLPRVRATREYTGDNLSALAFENIADGTPYTERGTAVRLTYRYLNNNLRTKTLSTAPAGVPRVITYGYENNNLKTATPSSVAT